MTTPYTYLLKSKTTGKLYYGLRYADGCTPDDFWVTYFTSSKPVEILIGQNGIDDFEYEIRKTFQSKEKAILWERKVIQRMGLIKRTDFLNQGSWPSIGNYVRTVEHRDHLSKLAKSPGGLVDAGKNTRWKSGKSNFEWTENSKKRASKTRKEKFKNGELNLSGEKNPFYGKSHSKTFKESRRKALGKKVMINGIKYDSIKYASEKIGKSRPWLKRRLESNDFKEYSYV